MLRGVPARLQQIQRTYSGGRVGEPPAGTAGEDFVYDGAGHSLCEAFPSLCGRERIPADGDGIQGAGVRGGSCGSCFTPEGDGPGKGLDEYNRGGIFLIQYLPLSLIVFYFHIQDTISTCSL